MSNQKQVIAKLPTTDPAKTVEVEVYYNLGGANFFAGTQEPRGYYLAARPVTSQDGFRTVTAFSGSASFLEAANRFNPKRLAEIAGKASDLPAYKQVIDKVLTKNNLTLEIQNSPVSV